MKWTPIIAIGCITLLIAIAMIKGIDGAVYGLGITALAGLGGYELKSYRDKRKGGG